MSKPGQRKVKRKSNPRRSTGGRISSYVKKEQEKVGSGVVIICRQNQPIRHTKIKYFSLEEARKIVKDYLSGLNDPDRVSSLLDETESRHKLLRSGEVMVFLLTEYESEVGFEAYQMLLERLDKLFD